MESARARLRELFASRTVGQWIAGAAALVAVLAAGWWLLHAPEAPVESTLPRAKAPVATATTAGPTTAPVPNADGPVVVQVAGAVRSPGVYRLSNGARVTDAIDAAGGVQTGADPGAIHLAARLVDGQRIVVPMTGEPPPAESTPESTGPVDLNTASVSDLDELPGVGPATAAAIVAYRNDHGRFASVDELAKVRGIGPAKLSALAGLIRV
jgi:competence protein ComEA